MPVYGAYGGLPWNSFINANNFSTECQLDGLAKPCSQVILKEFRDVNDRVGNPQQVQFHYMSRRYSYDQAGRISSVGSLENYPILPPFSGTYGYDAFNNLTSRSGKYALNPSQTDSGSYTNHRRAGWTYNAEGQVTNSNDHSDSGGSSTRAWTYDAAGKLGFVSEVRNGQTTTTALGHDGDGQVVIELFNGTTVNYLIRSTVLGTVLTKLKSNGGKDITYVPANGLVAPMQLQDQPFSTPASFMVWVSRDPLGIQENKNGFLYAIDPFGSLVANVQPPAGGPPPYMPVYGATYGGLTWNSFINANNFSTGCQLDGLAKPCSQVLFGAMNGFYEPRSGSLLPFGAVVEGWKTVPPGHQPPPGSRIVGEFAFEPEYGFSGNLFPEFERQNQGQKPMDTTKMEKLLTKDCLDFLNAILAQLKDPYSTTFLNVLKKAKEYPLYTKRLTAEEKKKRVGGAHKSVGAPDFYIYLDEDSYANDPYSLIHELFHGASGTGTTYTHFDMATAAYKVALADPAFMKYANRHGGLKEPKLPDYSTDSKDPEDWYNADVFDRIARHGCTHPIDWNW